MAKEKTSATVATKAIPKAKTSKAKEKKELRIAADLVASGDDAEVRRTRLKTLIALGKDPVAI